jgi:ankyrin repeat protein
MALIIVWEPGTLGHYWETFKNQLRKLIRPKIFDAIEQGDRELALKLAKKSRLQHDRDERGSSPLTASIIAGQRLIACDLIKCGGYFKGDGSIALAVMFGDNVILKSLIEINAELDEPISINKQDSGWTPLMWATNRHNYEAMKLLLSTGAQINSIANDGTTAVMCTRAGTEDDLAALEILCAYKPELTVKDWRGRTILDEARARAKFSNMPAMYEILQRYYPELPIFET